LADNQSALLEVAAAPKTEQVTKVKEVATRRAEKKAKAAAGNPKKRPAKPKNGVLQKRKPVTDIVDLVCVQVRSIVTSVVDEADQQRRTVIFAALRQEIDDIWPDRYFVPGGMRD